MSFDRRIAALSPEQRELLLRRLDRARKRGESAPRIGGTEGRTRAPASYSQRGLWFLDQLEGASVAYNVSTALHLLGPLDVSALERSVGEIVTRHASLRTSFATEGGEPVQVLGPSRTVTLEVADLRNIPEEKRSAAVDRLLAQWARRRFDLRDGSLLRVCLLRFGADEHLFAAASHHIVADGWSLRVFVHELGVVYSAGVVGSASPLPPLSCRYIDVSDWQQHEMDGERLEELLMYWKDRLEDAPAALELPTDHRRPPVHRFRGALRPIALPGELAQALADLGRRAGATPFMILVAGFAVLLRQCTGREDVVLATPVSGRTRAETEQLIGAFVNTLVLRIDVSGDPTFLELLARVRAATLGAFAHQDLPFERLVRALRPARDLSRNPLVQVALVLEDWPADTLAFRGLAVSPRGLDMGTAKTDLTISLREEPQGLVGTAEYDTDLFERETVDRLLADYRGLLQAAVDHPDRRLSELPPPSGVPGPPREPVTAPGERTRQILDRSNLTKNQLLIWLGQQLQPEIPLYNGVHTFAIPVDVDPRAFQVAFQALIDCSDVMRTVVLSVDGVPRQRVLRAFPYTVEYLDFSEAPDPTDRLSAWALERSRRPLDLSVCPFDSALIRLRDRQFVWYLNTHHIIADNWSNALIFRYTSLLYERVLGGDPAPSIRLPQYSEYLDQERQRRSRPEYQKAKDYWKRKVRESVPPLRFYGPIVPLRSARVDRVVCELGRARTEKIKGIALRDGFFLKTADASLFNLFAALLCAYLYRISGNRLLALGVPFHGRRGERCRETIGLVMEVLVLHVAIDGEDTLRSLTRKVAAEASACLEHRGYAVENPLDKRNYEVFLNFHTAKFQTFAGATVTPEWVHTGYENDILALQVLDYAATGCITLAFDLHRDVFGEEERARVARHFVRLLDAFLEDHDARIDDMELFSEEEREPVEPGEEEAGAGGTIVDRFEACVADGPDRCAVVYGEEALSYGGLNSRANRLARHLRTLGVGPESRVGLCLTRSLELTVAVLAVLKAGGAYVPLDPSYPAQRLALLVEDAGVGVIVTQTRWKESLPAQGPSLVLLDRDADRIEEKGGDNLRSGVATDNLAYVIYTSGTTGTPKGVMVTHRNLANAWLAWRRAYQLPTSCSRHLQMAGFAFDVFSGDIVRACCSGATLIVSPEETTAAPEKLLALMNREQADAAEFVPAVLRRLVDHMEKTQEKLAFMRLLIVGSEIWYVSDLQRLLRHCTPETRVVNSYGVCEATIDSSCYRHGEDGLAPEGVVPIGRALANMRLYIVRPNLQLVPVGVVGELCLGGLGVSRGYCGRPDLTAERFIPDPFDEGGGARVYCTGDLARRRSDGAVELLGRSDYQVKIRGIRVEPGEVEAALCEHPAVREAVVVTAADRAAETRLIAYLVLRSGERLDLSELRPFLKRKLPEFMIPAGFEILDAMPLTPNGKIDRRGLASRDWTGPQLRIPYVAPSSETERTIVAIWEEVLGRTRVGVQHNFFDLGGHSLLATQVISRVLDTCGVEVTLRTVFDAPTAADLARCVDDCRQAARDERSASTRNDGAREELEV